jgi:phosphatidylglycerol:prolipoprotein diacylglycerol transferase
VRYQGGELREQTLAGKVVVEGMVLHQTALYEALFLAALFLVLILVARRPNHGPSTIIGIFCVTYGCARYLIDFLRINDDRLAGLTGAQLLMVAVALGGTWVLFRVRPSLLGDAAGTSGSESEMEGS